MNLLLVICFFILNVMVTHAKRSKRLTRRNQIHCKLEKLEVALSSNGIVGDEVYVCVVTSYNNAMDQSYAVYLDEKTIEKVGQCKNPMLSIMGASMDPEEALLSLEKGAFEVYDSPETRRLAPKLGESEVLVLRVTYLGRSPSLSTSELEGAVFGTGRNPQTHSLASQMESCSAGKLRLGGTVTEISIDKKVSGSDEVLALDNAVIDKASTMFGRLTDSYEHVIMVFPSGLKFRGSEWLAYGYLDGWRSVFHDDWAGSLSALMHELGHNLGLHHSGQGKEHYGDISGYMGWGTMEKGGPTSCFNAQKNFDLGWFEDRVTMLTIDDLPWGGYLAFFGEYNLTLPEQTVVVNIGQQRDRIFMQYNRAKGVNAGTRAYPDQVVIVGDEGRRESWGEQSWFEGAIGLNPESSSRNYKVKSFEGTGHDIFIRVCEEVSGPPDYVRLSIHIDNGIHRHTCDDKLIVDSEFCDDDMMASFFVDANRGFKNCGWLMTVLKNYPPWFDKLCLPGQAAHGVCEETCKKCFDTCEDRAGTFFVNARHGYQDCNWLSTRAPWISKLCQEGSDALKYCTETCNLCD